MESAHRKREGCGIESRETLVIPELEQFVQEKVKPWTEHDLEVLRAYYSRIPVRRLADHLGRSMCAVQCKANGMGLSRRG